jgi:hypothetical protein
MEQLVSLPKLVFTTLIEDLISAGYRVRPGEMQNEWDVRYPDLSVLCSFWLREVTGSTPLYEVTIDKREKTIGSFAPLSEDPDVLVRQLHSAISQIRDGE